MSINGQQRTLAPKLANLQVVNRHTYEGPRDQSYVYIGRGTPLGNNWSFHPSTSAQYLVGNREEAVGQYRLWLWDQIQRGNNPAATTLNQLKERALKGEKLSLACSCSPQLCHGDVVKAAIEHLIQRDRPTHVQSEAQRIFVSGSRSIETLPAAARDLLDQHMSQGSLFLVGDANGADKLVQQYLHTANYQNVTVHHIGAEPRNNAGFQTVRVEGNRQTDKDAYMAEHADVGLAIWDGKSQGTANNIERLQTTVVSTNRLSERGVQAHLDVLANGASDNYRSQFVVDEGLTRGEHTTKLHHSNQFTRDAFERGASISDNVLSIPRDPDSRPQDGAKVTIGTEAHAINFVRGFIPDRAEAAEKGSRLFQIGEQACGQWTDSHGRLSIFTYLYDTIRLDEQGAYRSNEARAEIIDKALEENALWAEQLPQPAPEPTAEEIHEFTLALAEEAKHSQPQLEPEPVLAVDEEATRAAHLLYVHELDSNTHGLATIGDLTGLTSESFFQPDNLTIDENQVYSELFENAVADAIEFTSDHLALDPSPAGATLDATFDRINLDALPPSIPDSLSEQTEHYLLHELLPTVDAQLESGFSRNQILAPIYEANRTQQAEALQQRVQAALKQSPATHVEPSRQDQLNALTSMRLLIAGEYKHETKGFSREAIEWAKGNYRINPDQLRAGGKLKVGEYAEILSQQQTARTEWLHAHPGQQAPFRAQISRINALELAGHKINNRIQELNPTKAELLKSLDTVQSRIEVAKQDTVGRLSTFEQLEQRAANLEKAAAQYAQDARTSVPFTALKATVAENERERQIDAREGLNRGNNAGVAGHAGQTTALSSMQNDHANERKTELTKLLGHLVNPEIQTSLRETSAALQKEQEFFTRLAGREVQTSLDARAALQPTLSNLTVVSSVADNTRARLDPNAQPVAVPESRDARLYISLVSNEHLRIPVTNVSEYQVGTNALQECRLQSSVWHSLHTTTPITGHDQERDALANFVGDYVNFRLNDNATNQLSRNPVFREYSQRLSEARTTEELVETASAIRKENYEAYQQLQAHKADRSNPAPAQLPLNVSEMRQVFLTARPATDDKRLAGQMRDTLHNLSIFGKEKSDRVQLLAEGKMTPSPQLAKLLDNLEHRQTRPALNHFYASLRNPAPVRANTFNLYEAHKSLAPFERDYLHQHALAAKYEMLKQPTAPEQKVEAQILPSDRSAPVVTDLKESASYHRYLGEATFREAEKLATVSAQSSGHYASIENSTIAQGFSDKDVLTITHIVTNYDPETQKDVINYLQESQDPHQQVLADMISLTGDFQSAGWHHEVELSDLHLPDTYAAPADSVLKVVNYVQTEHTRSSPTLNPTLTEPLKAEARKETWQNLHANALKDPSLLVNGPASFRSEIHNVHSALHSAEQLQERASTASRVMGSHLESCVAKASAALAQETHRSDPQAESRAKLSSDHLRELVSSALNSQSGTQQLSADERQVFQAIDQSLTSHDRSFAAQLETYANSAQQDYANSFTGIDRAMDTARATEEQLITEISERYENASREAPTAQQRFEAIKENLENNILGERLQALYTEQSTNSNAQAQTVNDQSAARDVLPADVVLAAEAIAIEQAWQSFEPQEVRDAIAGRDVGEHVLAEAYNVIDQVDSAQTAHGVLLELHHQLAEFVDSKTTEAAEASRTENAIEAYNQTFAETLETASQTQDLVVAGEIKELQTTLQETTPASLVNDAREQTLTANQQTAVLSAHETASVKAQQVQEQPLFANVQQQAALRETTIAELKGPDKAHYETLRENVQRQETIVADAFKHVDTANEKLSETRVGHQLAQYQQLAVPVSQKVNDYLKETVQQEGFRALMDPLRHDEHIDQIGMIILQTGQEHNVSLDQSVTGLGQIQEISTNLFGSLREGLEIANQHLLQGIELGAQQIDARTQTLGVAATPQLLQPNGNDRPEAALDKLDKTEQATLDLTNTHDLVRDPLEHDPTIQTPDISSTIPTISDINIPEIGQGIHEEVAELVL